MCCAFRDSWRCPLFLTKSPLHVLQLFIAPATLEGYLYSSCCNLGYFITKVARVILPSFPGAVLQLVGLSRVYRCGFHLAGVLWVGPEACNPPRRGQAPSGSAEAETFLECECCILCDLDWATAHLAAPLPPSATAQNKHCANHVSLKQAISENCCASTKIKTNQSGQ